MDFSEQQLERYSRHILLEDIGVEGQEKILNAKVLIIGTGGLGSPAALYLAAFWIFNGSVIAFSISHLFKSRSLY